MKDTLLIIDGHSMAFRAFYALPADKFATSSGQHTNAVYGFVSMLIRLLENWKPTHIAVAFDVSRASFRTLEYPEYKGTREATPEEFRGQVELIQQVLDVMGIRSLSREGYEADDILATLAHRGDQRNWRVLVASGDRDSFQTVTENVTVLYPGQGANDMREMTPQAVEDKYGVPPHRYPEIAALVGETSDNLPGVPGVGPKTAAQWITAYDGLENLLAQADSIGGKRGVALREHMDDVRRNRRLNHLLTDLDVGVELEDLRREVTDRRALNELFDVLEIGGLRTRVIEVAAIGLAPGHVDDVPAPVEEDVFGVPDPVVTLGTSAGAIREWCTQHPGRLALWVDGHRYVNGADAHRLVFAQGEQCLVVECGDVDAETDTLLADLLSRGDYVVHDTKGTAHALAARGWELAAPGDDVELAAYLVNPEHRGYSLKELAQRYLSYEFPADEAPEELFSLNAGDEPSLQQIEAGRRAVVLGLLAETIRGTLHTSGADDLLHQVEIPMAMTLTRMENLGIAVDLAFCEELSCELGRDVEDARRGAWSVIGKEINLSSPKQIQEVLFTDLGLPKTKKTKTGYTTNAEALQDLFERTGHDFLRYLLAHRDRIKLKQIVDGLIAATGADGRIHSTFSQVAAATGRLSSSDPNLQNIPARSPEGLRIRGGFVPGDGYESLMSVDYSQIEMRIMAHLSRDAGLIEAFASGEDLHRTMAAMVFGIPANEVTGEQRSRIKATSYGLAYGLSAYGLSAQLHISVPEASALRDRYFERFGGVRDYLESLVDGARRDGWTATMLGRRRYLPDLQSANRQRREMAERAALNAPIQGSAADIMKKAMIRIDEALRASALTSRMLVQIHDELLFEVAPGEREALEELVRREMSDAMATELKLTVPLDVAVGVGATWKDAAH